MQMRLGEVNKIIQQLEDLDPYYENIYKNALNIFKSFSQLPLLVFQLPANKEIFRARPHEKDIYLNEIGQLANPPENCVENFGRCNSPYQSIFYGAENRPAAYLELLDYFVQDKEIGDEVFASLTRWITLSPLSLLIIPSPDPAKRQAFNEQYLGVPLDDALAKQEKPQREASATFFDYMFDKFRKYANNDIKTYAITSAYSNLAFLQSKNTDYQIDGVMYPSVPRQGEGINFAIDPKIIAYENFYPNLAARNRFVVDAINEKGHVSFTEKESFLTEHIDLSTGTVHWENGYYTYQIGPKTVCRMSSDKESLIKLIEEQYFKAQEEGDPEEKGVELKSRWPRLDKNQDKKQLKINTSKILKEIVAIANSYRAGPGYVIIGIDGKTGTITDSPFTVTGLSETLDFYELMVKHVEKPVDYEIHQIKTAIDGTEKTVSVIVIPPSLSKPHVIKNYVTEKWEREQFTPVKKDTGIRSASRDDLELIYYDKANIEPEYALNILTNLPTIYTSKNPKPNVNLPVIFENYGRKPVILTTCRLVIPPQTFNFDGFSSNENYEFEMYHYTKEDGVYGNDFQLKNNPLIIGSNQAISYKCYFQPPLTYDELTNILGSSSFQYYFWARDAVGNVYKSKFFQKH